MIRQYQLEDADAVVAIWRAASQLAHPFLTDAFLSQEAANLRALYLPNAETWLSEEDGAPVGFIALIGDEIGGFFLAPAYHGRGLGKALVDHAVALKGALRVEVFERNQIGRSFYQRYGFRETGRYRHDGSGEIALKLTLPRIE
ncbi:MAG: GNAT family N-acetyltransferase [Rhodobacteraceae bacterium]|nr:GNAT family N-acetyltransferase [Paracoccaceae bacterium]